MKRQSRVTCITYFTIPRNVNNPRTVNRIEFLKDARQRRMRRAELARGAAEAAVVFCKDVKNDACGGFQINGIEVVEFRVERDRD